MAKKFTSKIGLKPIYSTKDPNGNPATLGESGCQIIRDNLELIEEILEGKADEENENGKVVRSEDGTIDVSDKADKQNEAGDVVAYTKDGTAVTTGDFTKAMEKKADGLYVDPADNQLFLKSGEKLLGTGITLPKTGGGVPNVSDMSDKYDYASKQDGRDALPAEDRKRGQVITYQIKSGEWVLDMFIGDSTGSWGNAGSWRSFLTEADLKSLLADIQTLQNDVAILKGKTDIIPDDFDIDEDNKLYLTANGQRINDGVQLPEGGGGSGSNIILRVRPIGLTTFTAGENADVIIKYSFSSTESDTGDDTGPGTYIVSVNGVSVASGVANQGDNEFNLKGYIFLGSNTVRIRVTDSYGQSKSVTWNIQVATLLLTSTFADDTVYMTNPVPFRYTPVGIGQKTIRFFLDDRELDPDITDTSGRQMTKQLTGLTNGSHSLRVFAESTIAGSTLKSNELYFEFIYADATITLPVIALSYNKTQVQQFSMIDIPFMVFNPASPTANVTIRVNGQLASQLTVPRTKQHFPYQANAEGLLTITFTVGAVSRTLNIEVIKSELEIREELADLEYKAVATGKSNSGDDRDKWNYNGHTATFTGFSWADDGWQKDDAGNNCLRLLSDNKVSIDIKPFANDILVTGATLTVEYSTKEVTSDEAVLMTSMFAGIGIEFTPTSVTLKSAQSTLTARYDSNQKISVSLVIQKRAEYRLVYLFVDGIASGTLQYPDNDNFTQSTQKPFELSTGDRACQLQVYGIRWYKNSLNFDQVLGNYIFDIENLDDKLTVYTRNQLIDAYGNIDYTRALQFLPCMTFIGDLPNYKGDKKPTDIIYEDAQNPNNSFTSQGAQNDVQGTSSQFYPRPNFKFKFKNGFLYTESGEPGTKYPLGGSGIPAEVFCLKADFAESSGTHNTGIAVLIDQMLKDFGILTPPQKENPKVRTTVDGFPILLFHKETASSQTQFVGKYNFNYDKAAEEVFGFGAGDICVEFRNNTSNLCLFKDSNFANWQDDLESRYPDGGTDVSLIMPIWEWVVSCIGNPDKFKAECSQYWDVQNLLFTYVNVEVLTRTDQAAKNQFITIFKKDGKARFIDYDNDTALGINNEGMIAFSPYVEFEDQVSSGYVWNGWDSELWRLVRAAYPAEIKAMYKDLRQKQILTPARVLEILQKHQADKWCELIYNQDGKYKYIDPLVDGYYDYSSGSPVLVKTGAFLYALQGSRTRHRLWYVGERFEYMDGKYDAGGHINDTVSMRLYTPTSWTGVAPNPDFNVSMVKAGYIRALFGSVKTDGIRGYANQSYTLKAPTGAQLNDTETVVYGVSAIKSLGDLSEKYLGTMDISKAASLEDLLIGSTVSGYKNENLHSLSTGANGRLKKVNVAGCPNLIQSLDFSQCYSLEEVEARNSGVTGFSLPNSGVLKRLYLPATFAALVLKNQPLLNTLSLQGYANLNTVAIENVPGIDGYALVKNSVNTVGSKLSKVRLIGINATDANSKTLNAIALMTGQDENDQPTDKAVVTGKIHINQITQGALDRFRALWPQLTITYSQLLDVIDFEDVIVKGIMVGLYDTNDDGELSTTEVAGQVLTSNLLMDSGAKRFNEAHNWTGGTATNNSPVNNCETLESVSILSGITYLRNLQALKRVELYEGPNDKIIADVPLFGYNSIGNCYAIEEFILRGRYIENSNKGMIMGKVIGSAGTYYRGCFPLKGHKVITIDEPFYFDNVSANPEATYPHGREIETLNIGTSLGFSLTSLQALKTINVNGLMLGNNNSFSFTNPNTFGALQNINIIDSLNNGGMMHNFTAGTGGNTLKKVNVLVDCQSTATGIFTVPVYANLNRVDLSERYTPQSVNVTTAQYEYGFFGVATLIIRANKVIPNSGSINANSYNQPLQLFVPDDLVASYKATSVWNSAKVNVRPISQLG